MARWFAHFLLNAFVNLVIRRPEVPAEAEDSHAGRPVHCGGNLYKADVLHTLDDQLIGLSGGAVVDGLKIERPRPFSGQPVLF